MTNVQVLPNQTPTLAYEEGGCETGRLKGKGKKARVQDTSKTLFGQAKKEARERGKGKKREKEKRERANFDLFHAEERAPRRVAPRLRLLSERMSTTLCADSPLRKRTCIRPPYCLM